MATIPSSSASLLSAPSSQSRKRRHSALEFLTINPTVPGLEQAKRPRILIVDEDSEGAQHPSPDFPQGSTTTAEVIDSSSPSAEDSSETESTSSSGLSSEGDDSEKGSSDEYASAQDIPADAQGVSILSGEEDEADRRESGTSPSSSSTVSESEDNDLPYSTPTPGVSLPTGHIHLLRPTQPRLGSTASSRSASSSRPPPKSLHSRLKNFLPQLHAANTHLETLRDAGTLEKHNIELEDGQHENVDVGDDADDESESGGKQYIEMNLGLGVLEERNGAESESSSSESSASSVAGDDVENGGVALDGETVEKAKGERQVLRKLMGKAKEQRPDIRVVEDGGGEDMAE
jgi:Domain of unknown function (DUF4598)